MREPSQNHITLKSGLVLSPEHLPAPTRGNLLSNPTPRFATCGELGDPVSALPSGGMRKIILSYYRKHLRCARHFVCLSLSNFHNSSVIIIPIL